MFERLEEVKGRFMAVESQLGDPEIAANPKEYQKLAKEHGQLREIVDAFDRYTQAQAEITENKLLIKDPDPDMREMAKEEISSLETEIEELETRIKLMLIPRDPMDDKNIFLEIRAGTGGDEAALFVADLFRMYSRYADNHKWKVEVQSASESEKGGLKVIVAMITGNEVYSHLKYESGTHRVQRVPETESQGRIHTSACTVAILPEVDDVEVTIRNEDIRIDTYRSSGAGGQHVNTTDSAIRITYLPTGLIVTCQDEKSQHKNKAKALKELQSRVYEMERQAQHDEIAAERKGQIGSGDRSERIRTYNYPQNRCTDHRINFTSYNLDGIMNGSLTLVIDPLRTHYQTEALKALES